MQEKTLHLFTDKVILQQAALRFHDNIDKTRDRMAENRREEVPQMTGGLTYSDSFGAGADLAL